MDNLKFKTTIKCTGCLAAVKPYLDQLAGEDHWEVDLQNSDKILTVSASEKATAERVAAVLQEAGYKAEPLS